VNSDQPVTPFKQIIPWLIGAIGMGCVSVAAYVVLNTVSKPYWTIGSQIPVGTDYYQTLFVFNPGPWATRTPEVEFHSLSNSIQIISFSPGVKISNDSDEVCAQPGEGLVPGGIYFITYKYSANLAWEARPDVICDGKLCKDDPTFDLDLTLKCLLLLGGLCILACFFTVGYCGKVVGELRYEKQSTIRTAIAELLAARKADVDVLESARALATLLNGVKDGTVHIKAKPVRPS